MNPVIFQIWGPLAIHAYGLCIAVGAVIAIFLLTHDEKMKKIVSQDQLMTSLQLIIVAGYFGGRLGFLISESEPWCNYMMLLKFWEPGLSILGSILGVVCVLGYFLQRNKISVLPFLDRVALYAPIAQSFGRVGCFFAGCCFGAQSFLLWSVTYTDVSCMAPLYQSLHPAQLYSAVILGSIFFLQYFVIQKLSKTAGVLFFSYLLLVSFERFLIDFFRADRIFFNSTYFSYFSIHQWIAVGIMIIASCGFIIVQQQNKR